MKYLFGQEARDRQRSENVFAITPHIVRSNGIVDDNLKMVDIGTGTNVTYRSSELPTAPARPAFNRQHQQGAFYRYTCPQHGSLSSSSAIASSATISKQQRGFEVAR